MFSEVEDFGTKCMEQYSERCRSYSTDRNGEWLNHRVHRREQETKCLRQDNCIFLVRLNSNYQIFHGQRANYMLKISPASGLAQLVITSIWISIHLIMQSSQNRIVMRSSDARVFPLCCWKCGVNTFFSHTLAICGGRCQEYVGPPTYVTRYELCWL